MAKKKKESNISFDSIQSVMATINKRFGKDSIMMADKATALSVERIPFGVFDLDLKIGGGVPRGRLMQLKGDYSVGKSCLAHKAVASFQRHCRFCGTEFEHIDPFGEVTSKKCLCGKNDPHRVVWIDAEHCFENSWALKFNIRVGDIAVLRPESAEQAIDTIDILIRSKECDLVVLDSIASLSPQDEIDREADADLMAKFARQMGKALRKWTSGMNTFGLTSELKCTAILINQVRLNLGGYVVGYTNPGGKALDAHSSLNINFKRTGPIEDDKSKRTVGINVDYVVTKNKTYPPYLSGKFELYTAQNNRYPIGESDVDKQIIRMATYWQLLHKGGAGWTTLPDGSKAQGEEAVADKIMQDPALFHSLSESIKKLEFDFAHNYKKTEDIPADKKEVEQKDIIDEGF